MSAIESEKDEAASLIEENQTLKAELMKTEDHLASLKAERQKYGELGGPPLQVI